MEGRVRSQPAQKSKTNKWPWRHRADESLQGLERGPIRASFPRRRPLTSNSPVVSPPSFQTSNFIPDFRGFLCKHTASRQASDATCDPLRQPPTQKWTSPTFLNLSSPSGSLLFRPSLSSDRRG
ncbi:hypothetical protein WN51_13854 [Melipona quadrifasciata]|uniref:Uncharacterized protein n=1 Tax=Melipona quadrifasciata TaxID=166423 RepID=A0A0M9A0D7_9HYME|nr:hypothetical protein WN51_13854 [Melipona quadrifasciata]